jgi:hypothetical protein
MAKDKKDRPPVGPDTEYSRKRQDKLLDILPLLNGLMALLLKVKPRDDLFNVFNQQHSVL